MGEGLLDFYYVDLDNCTNAFAVSRTESILQTVTEVVEFERFVLHPSACTSFHRSGIGLVFVKGTGVDAGSSADHTNCGCCGSLIGTVNAGFGHKNSR